MKRILFSMLLLSSAVIGLSSGAIAQTEQTHFDNKPYIKGEFLVQLKYRKSMKEVVSSIPEVFNCKLEKLLSKQMRVYLVSFDDTKISHQEMQAMLYKNEEVSLVDYNYKLKLRATVPNDANFSQQWHHVNTGQTGGTTDADIDSDEAWDITTGGSAATGEDIVVCMIESGNLDHTDIAPNRWINTGEIPNNNIDDDGNGYIDDYNGWNVSSNDDNYGSGPHGTNCLGMIGAKGNNGSLVAGANWDVKLMVVADQSAGSQASVIEAYTYPLTLRQTWNNTNGAQGAFVVATSASWGLDGANPANYPLWCQFYDTLGKYGIINVGATTNSNTNVDVAGDMPTACSSPYMVGVGRTDHNDNTAGGYGLTTIDFGAPGIDVVTTAGSSGTTTTTGTSFSCPLTAGVVGLAYSIPCPSFMNLVKSNPQQGADMVLQALFTGVDVKTQLQNKFIHGGRLNAKNTIDILMANTCSGNLCLSPGGVSVSSITATDATISWNAFSSADHYILHYKEVGAPAYLTDTTSNLTYSMNSLMPCSEYEFYFESVCGTDTSSAGSLNTFNTLGCGNCVDLNYCTNNATDANDEWIESVEIDAFTNISGNDNGYGNFTNGGTSSLTLDINSTSNITLTPGWGGALYDEQFKVYIDLDQNGVFDPSDLVYDQGTATQAPATGTITIPGTATLGSTRMRVIMAYIGNNTTFPSECGTFTYGEVEDYCVEIIQSVICGMNVNPTVSDPTCSGVDDGSIALAVSGGTSGYSYNWGTLGTANAISNLSAGNYQVTVTDGSGCDTTMSYTLNNTLTLDASATSNDISCNGLMDGSASVTATGSSNYSYSWSQNGSVIGTTQSVSNLGVGVVYVTVTDANGCSANSAVSINQPSPVMAGFSTQLNGLNANFNNSSSAGSYAWDFGDGNTSASTNPSHTYNTPGTYTVCVTVTDPNCGSDNYCNNITVEDNASYITTEESYVSVFPNPAENNITVRSNSVDIGGFILLDATGKHVLTKNLNSISTQISLAELASGIYIYNVLDTNGKVIQVSKLTIQK